MKKVQDYQYYTYRSRHQYSTNLQSFSRHPLLTPPLLQITPKMLRKKVNPIDKEELKQQLSRKRPKASILSWYNKRQQFTKS